MQTEITKIVVTNVKKIHAEILAGLGVKSMKQIATVEDMDGYVRMLTIVTADTRANHLAIKRVADEIAALLAKQDAALKEAETMRDAAIAAQATFKPAPAKKNATAKPAPAPKKEEKKRGWSLF